jgi:hypothetical protein
MRRLRRWFPATWSFPGDKRSRFRDVVSPGTQDVAEKPA